MVRSVSRPPTVHGASKNFWMWSGHSRIRRHSEPGRSKLGNTLIESKYRAARHLSPSIRCSTRHPPALLRLPQDTEPVCTSQCTRSLSNTSKVPTFAHTSGPSPTSLAAGASPACVSASRSTEGGQTHVLRNARILAYLPSHASPLFRLQPSPSPPFRIL